VVRKIKVLLISGAICLLGVIPALAQGQYSTLAEYEKATGKRITKFNEAPMLRTKVAAGELLPVEERLPEEPFVEEPFEEIGQYGGTLHVLAVNPTGWNDVQDVRDPTLTSLFEPSKDGEHPVPNIAKGFKWSEDFKTLTIYLRKGLKWSDGYPFTADDILFVINDVYQNKELTPTPPFWLSPTKEIKKAEKVDDYTVNINFPEPYPAFEASLTTPRMGQLCTSWSAGIYSPKHYLKRWHIKYNPKANELAKEEGFERWWQAYKHHAQILPLQNDLDLPSMGVWILKKKTTSAKVFERNPYYWKVDPAGNQLPYIDKVVSTIVDPEVYQLKVISGEADFAMRGLSLKNYPLYKENEEKGDYHVVLIPGINGSELVLELNLNHPDLVLRKICQDIRFRRALSVAINRAEINDSVFFGKAVPRQWTWVPNYPGVDYKEEWAKAYAQYDPELANQLLDEMGLTKRDKDGFRLRPDGKPILLVIEYVEGELNGPILELVKEYWESVGIKVFLKPESVDLWHTRMQSSDHGVTAVTFAEVTSWVGPNMINWFNWFETGGKEGEEPPEEYKEEARNWRKWSLASAVGKEKTEIMTKLGDSQARNLWGIGTVGMAPVPLIVKNDLGNVVDPKQVCSYVIIKELMKYYEQLFFKK